MKPAIVLYATSVFALTTIPAFGDEPALEPSEPASPPPRPMPADNAEEVAPPSRSPYDVVRVNAGFRFGYVPSRGFDTFASNDVLAQFSLDGTYPLVTSGRFVLAAGVGWDFGGRSAKTRGFDASLAAHRLSVPIEGRWHFAPWIYGFGKVSPGAVAILTKVDDPSSGQTLSATGWALSGDASLGASLLLGPRRRDPDKRAIQLWATPEVGWSLSSNAPVTANLGRDEKELLGSDENTRLRSVALSGFFWRVSFGASF